jgi:hypothetical protein
MGLNNAPQDAQVRDDEVDMWEDDVVGVGDTNCRGDADEDYYTSKYIRIHQGGGGGQRKGTELVDPGAKSKKRDNNKLSKKKSGQVSQSCHSGRGCGLSGGTSIASDSSATHTLKPSQKTLLSRHITKTKHATRQVHRSRKNNDETAAYMPFDEKSLMYNHRRKGIHNTENSQPELNVISMGNNNKAPDSCNNIKASNIELLLKTIGIKRDPRRVESAAAAAAGLHRDQSCTLTGPSPSPFAQSLDPTIFKGSGESDVGVGEGASCGSLSDLSVTHAIFEALFGQASGGFCHHQPAEQRNEEREGESRGVPRWDDVEDEDVDTYEEVQDPLALAGLALRTIPQVDEQWFAGVLRSRSNSRSNSWGSASSRHSDEGPSSSCGRSHTRSRSNSMTLTSPLLSRSNTFSDVTPLLSSAAFEYALSVAASPPEGDFLADTPCGDHVAGVDCRLSRHEGVSTEDAQQQQQQQARPPPASQLVESYITPDLITQLVLQLPHDDDRVTSPRLSVLKALHKNCASMRSTISNALELASYNRVLRCQQNKHMAKSLNLHYDDASAAVFRHDFTDDDPLCETTAATAPPFASSRAGVSKFRDHDGSIVELALFIAVTVFTSPVKLSDGTIHASSDMHDTFSSLVSTVSNVLRCYGCHLSSAAGTVDDCTVLKTIIKIVTVCLSYFKSLDPSGTKACSGAQQLLERLVKHWPRGDTMRELAYWKVSAVVLPFISLAAGVTATGTQTVTGSTGVDVTAGAGLTPVSPCILPRLKRKSSPAQTIITKLMSAVTSTHFKIAIQAIQVAMQKDILLPFFITADSSRNSTVLSLVEALRSNRQHWHAVVKATSENALDMLLDYL